MSNKVTAYIFLLILSGALAYFVGRKRRVGFFWSIFFSLFLSPLGGLIITLNSVKRADFYSPRSRSRLNWSNGALFLGGFLFLGTLYSLYTKDYSNGLNQSSQFSNLWISIGFIGIGIYTINTEKDINLTK